MNLIPIIGSLFIAKFAKKITMVHQFGTFTSNKTAQEKILSNPKIEVLFEHEPRSFKRIGDKMYTEVEDLKTREHKMLVSDGIFIFIGMKPNISIFKDLLELDTWNYIKTDEDMRTNIPDIYAVGDVTSKKYRQITTAVADGTIAAISIARDLS
jgi:thioredoxin reductase (NADPH)